MHQDFCLAGRNDRPRRIRYHRGMASPAHDWYLKEWLRTLKKKQADIVRDLDWNKARVSLMIRGEQQYTRDSINELATYLSVHPYELLMHPEDAMSLRQLRKDALTVVKTSKTLQEPANDRTGTNG
jgi:plasmid maintenance system antidote protein VapI